MKSRISLPVLLSLLMVLTAISSVGPISASAQNIHGSSLQLGRETPSLPLENIAEGSVKIPDTPFSLNIPQGYGFIPLEDAREFLIYRGVDPASMQTMAGLVVPMQALSSADPDHLQGYIVEYYDTGHVDDASGINFHNVIKEMRESTSRAPYIIDWVWTPSYDKWSHVLSLPVTFSEFTDSVRPTHTVMAFGRNSTVKVSAFGATSQKALLDMSPAIQKMVEFAPGETYEDYTPKAGDLYYPSLMDFLHGKQREVAATPMSVKMAQRPFPRPARGWIIALGTLLGLAFLCLLLSRLTRVTNPIPGRSLRRLSVNSLLRLGVFFSVYFFLVLAGVLLIVYGVQLTGYLAFLMPDLSIFAYAALWLVILTVAVILISPLFRLPVKARHPGLEISPDEAPELFDLIAETARETGMKMPKKVFLSYQPNAMVFYDTALWNIIFPVRKNLLVGLGLLYFTNRSELKAVIAHEFGHFGQGSMRIGSAVGVGYKIATDVAGASAFIIPFFPNITRIPALIATFVTGNVMRRLAIFVQRGFGPLQKEMEYCADAVSADIVGNGVAVSAQYKSTVIAGRVAVYNEILTRLASNDGKVPESYWQGYESFLLISSDWDGHAISSEKIEDMPLGVHAESRLFAENIWESHPSQKERVAQIRSADRPARQVDTRRALDMVRPDIFEKVSRRLFDQAGFGSAQTVDTEEYKRIVAVELSLYSFPPEMRPFFAGEIVPLDLDELTPCDYGEEIFSRENAAYMAEILQAAADLRAMRDFSQGRSLHKRIRYRDRLYTPQNIPVHEQEVYVRSLDGRAKEIEGRICATAMARSGDPEMIRKAYDDIFYSQYIQSKIVDYLLPLRDIAYKALMKRPGELDPKDYKVLQKTLVNYRDAVREVLSQIEMDRLAPVMSGDLMEHYIRVRDDDTTFMSSAIIPSEVESMMELPEQLLRHFSDLAYFSKKKVTDTLEGKTPILSWSGSLAESRE